MAARSDQINNLLNRQLSGLYRRSQISLNAPTPQPVASTSSAILEENVTDDSNTEATPYGSNAPSPSLPPADTSAAAAASTLKRKTRSSETSLNGPSSVAAVEADKNGAVAPPTPSASSKRTRSSALSSKTGGAGPTKPNNRKPPSARLADLGGIASCIEQVLELIAMPICHPEIYLHTGVRPPRGVLLYGPPGCGKTALANAIAGEIGVAFISVSAPSIVSGMSGESEKTLRDTFEEAAKLAPCILFIDEIDAITPKRENAQREMERRIVAQLLTCMDDLSWEKTDNKPVMIIGATNRPDSLDPALRRAGRFDHEIAMGVPDEQAREQILKVLSTKLRLAGDFDFRALAKATPGYVGADLSALTGAAGIIAVKRIFQDLGIAVSGEAGVDLVDAGVMEDMILDPPSLASISLDPSKAEEIKAIQSKLEGDGPQHSLFDSLPPELQILSIASFLKNHPNALTEEQLEPLSITLNDFQEALKQVQPSSKREGFTTVPDVSWSNVGALSDIRDELRMAIVQPVKHPELFEAVGIANPCGVLLWGPPGCGKTLLAKAVANESRANFISVKGPELLNKYVGESERAVRQVFSRARASSPCIVFFDELDALVPRRDDNLSEASARVVNTLLTELDGLTPRKQVFVIGATNRPDMVDPAMVRPGRLDKLLYVDLPSPEERMEILKTLTKSVPLDLGNIDLGAIASDSRCDGFSGADIGALVREAAVAALRQALPSSIEEDTDEMVTTREKPVVLIKAAHFDKALSKVFPSVSSQQRRKYENLRNRFEGTPVGNRKDRVADVPAAEPSVGSLDGVAPAMA